ncbi:DUF3040 domain-containing protein [Nonomuraea sp. JJY05]|uniref:DUF3040 domain-containing protein n=1 Tax=Nonomuraea sp. JJY05 TaxID=3350255 RepID=UPI00373EFDD0
MDSAEREHRLLKEIEQNLRQQDRAFASRMDALNTASARQGPQRFACHTTRHELVGVFLAVVILTALSMLLILTVGRTHIPPATPVDTAVSGNSTFAFVSELTAGLSAGRIDARRVDGVHPCQEPAAWQGVAFERLPPGL